MKIYAINITGLYNASFNFSSTGIFLTVQSAFFDDMLSFEHV